MSNNSDFFKLHKWYPYLSAYTFPTSFVRLRPEGAAYLAASEQERKEFPRSVSKQIIADLKLVMPRLHGSCFTSTDLCAPTDTDRFKKKHGAVHSAESAWKFLCQSEKIRTAAQKGEIEFIAVRPFRHMNKAREFRLFIRNGKLAAMSQYWLIRHFSLLDKKGQFYWEKAQKMAESVIWQLPVDDFVMDIYITSDDEVLIIDLNPWGEPTDPLLLRSWDRADWDNTPGLQIMSPPLKISGDVHVSF